MGSVGEGETGRRDDGVTWRVGDGEGGIGKAEGGIRRGTTERGRLGDWEQGV